MIRRTQDNEKRERLEFRMVVLFAAAVMAGAYAAAGVLLVEKAGNHSANAQVRYVQPAVVAIR